MQLNCTLAGRLMLGPAVTMLRLWAGEFRRPVDGRHAGVWLSHVIGVVVVLSCAPRPSLPFPPES
jgi:hypothetical protein